MRQPTPEERDAARIQVERAIQLVGSINRVRLSPDDPVLVVHTLLQDFLMQADERQQDALRAFQVDLERSRVAWEEASRHRAETVLAAALEAAREAIGADFQDAAHRLAQTSAASLNGTIAAKLAPLGPAAREARRAATLNILAAVITLVAATIVVASMLYLR